MLHKDQIHNEPFIKACTHIWSDDVSRSQKSGVWDYYLEISERYNKPLINESNLPDKAIIFVGMCHLLEDVYNKVKRNGSYIIVHRTNDRPYTEQMHALKPDSVNAVYTVDCRPTADNLFAIPFGNSSINGEDPFIEDAYNLKVEPANTKVFVRYNVNGSTPHRNEALQYLRNKPWALVIEHQIPQDEFFKLCKAHKFTMSLAGCGADASRQWSAIQLGSIPIVTDCPEMRHFEDMPMVFCPKNINELTEEWLSLQTVNWENTERMRASYWVKHIESKRREL